jgi:hypothetical protein
MRLFEEYKVPTKENFVIYNTKNEFIDVYNKVMSGKITKINDDYTFDINHLKNFISLYFKNLIEIKNTIHLLNFLIHFKDELVIRFLKYYLFETKEIVKRKNTYQEDIVTRFLIKNVMYVSGDPIIYAAFYYFIDPTTFYNHLKNFQEYEISKYEALKQFLGESFEQYITIYTLRG